MKDRISGLAAAAVLAGCAVVNPASAERAAVKPASAESAVVEPVSAERETKPFLHISYSGRWQRVEHHFDGRLRGESMRSYGALGMVTVLFSGSRLRIHGVTGPQGGTGIVVLGGYPSQTISFYSPVKRTHALVYESPVLSTRINSATVVVAPRSDKFPHRGYVNIDQIEGK